jgi:hypothetical protein
MINRLYKFVNKVNVFSRIPLYVNKDYVEPNIINVQKKNGVFS